MKILGKIKIFVQDLIVRIRTALLKVSLFIVFSENDAHLTRPSCLMSTENHAITTKTTLNHFVRVARIMRVCAIHPFLFHEFPMILFILTIFPGIICSPLFCFISIIIFIFYYAPVLLELCSMYSMCM